MNPYYSSVIPLTHPLKARFVQALPIAFILSGSLGYAMPGHTQTLFIENFEDSTISYTLSTAESSDGTNDYFGRVGPDGGLTIDNANTPSGLPSGTGFFGAEDIDNAPTPVTLPGVITFNSINITGATDLEFSGFFAGSGSASYDNSPGNDFLQVEYQIDSGSFMDLFALASNGTGVSDPLAVDTDFDGTGDGAVITTTATQFTRPITGTGSTLNLRISVASNGNTEAFFFDDIEIQGTTEIPEPSTLLGTLLAVGMGGAAFLKHRATTRSS